MSFKFPIQPDDDLPTPRELPAELAALGKQLEADALRLGKTYPSCQPPLELIAALEQQSRRRWYLRSWVIGLASSAALLLIAVGLYGLRSGETNTFPTKPAVVQTGAQAAGAANVDQAKVDAVATGNVPVQPVSYRPALADVNGPELEGLLDLLDEQPQSAAVISF